MLDRRASPFKACGATVALLAATLCRAGSPPAPHTVKPPTFVATYSVAWHGITAGHTTLTLVQTGPDEYRYSSVDRADGLFRLFVGGGITQESRFRLVNGHVQPLRFRSHGGGPPQNVRFDWASGRVIGTAKHKHIDLKLEPDTQDPGSVQIALMLAFLRGHPPASFWMLNTDVINRFEFVHRGEATLKTPLGPLPTVLYTSHHAKARRTTYMWLAPSLDYMPARLEQRRGDSTLFSLNILSYKRT
jgi:hypothetical protein